MEYDQLKRLVRESYPFPIAHAHKKTLGLLDDDAQKLKCLIETAENTMQFLALTALAQLWHDLRQGQFPGQPGVYDSIRDNLRNPSFGKWIAILRDVMKGYRDSKNLLVVPELFDFCFLDTRGKMLRMQLIHERVVTPLNNLRNDFHHLRIPESQVSAKVSEGLALLHQLLESLGFLSGYQLSFIQRIMADRDKTHRSTYTHDMVQFSGCFSTPDQVRWQSDIHLQKGVIVFLHGSQGRHLILNPFITFADQIPVPGVQDVFLLNKTDKDQCFYVSSQFGQTLGTRREGWADGPAQQELLIEFFDRLRMAKDSGEAVEIDLSEQSVPQEIPSPFSTAEVFEKQYLKGEAEVVHASPYKFLDYYNPEDHDLFFGRDQEIRVLQQKFHGTRLLVLHGKSGTGKSSLIRAGLIPRLSAESYVAVYVRALKEPINEIKRELIRQLKRDERNLQLPLSLFIQRETELLSKTVVIVLDQFEEFFLRLPEEVRQEFENELAICLETPQLDVKFLISIRDDYFANLAEFEPKIPHVFTHQIQLLHLSEVQALDAVVEPPKRLGMEIDEAMVRDKILPDLVSEEGVEAPLLQIVCDALYRNANGEGRFTIGRRDFEAIGDVKGTLGRYLEEKLRQFGTNQREAKEVLKALVTVQGTKQACFIEDLVSRINSSGLSMKGDELRLNYLDRFALRDRLVRVDEVEGRARYELSHEYLVKHIESWIQETDRELKKVLELIDRAYEAYKATGLLLESSALDLIAPLNNQLVLIPEKQAFLTESKTRARQKRRELLMRVAAMLAGVALVVGGFFGYKAYRSYRDLQANIGLLLNEKGDKVLGEAEVNAARLYYLNALDKMDRARVAERSHALGQLISHPGVFNMVLEGRMHTTTSVVFSPDGRTLASGSDKSVRLWDVETGKQKAQLMGHEAMVLSVSFSPDGRTLASGSADKTIRLWDARTGKLKAQLTGHQGDVYSVCFSPDGKTLASASVDKTIRLWDTQTGKQKAVLNGHRNEVRGVCFSPDGTTLASGSTDTTVRLWDIVTQKQKALRDFGSAVFCLAFSPDGKSLAAGCGDNNTHLWNLQTGEQKALFPYQGVGLILSVSFSPDGRTLASGSFDHTIKLWDVETETQKVILSGHNSTVLCVGFSPDGATLASGSADKTIRLWDLETAKQKVVLLGHTDWIMSLAFSPDSTILASGSKDRNIRLWDMQTGKQKALMEGHKGAVYSVCFSPDGATLASGSTDKTIRLWDVQTGKQKALLPGHQGMIYSLSFSPDGRTLASGSADKTIRLWDVQTGKPKAVLVGHESDVTSVAFSPDGRTLASGSEDRTVRLWNVQTGEQKAVLTGHKQGIYCVCYSPDGRTLASNSFDATIHLWDPETARLKNVIRDPHLMLAIGLSFSPDSKTLASGGAADNKVRLWDVETRTEKAVLSGHNGGVIPVAFSPDGKTLASGDDDETIRIWKMTDYYGVQHSVVERIKQAEGDYNVRLEEINVRGVTPSDHMHSPGWPEDHPMHWLAAAKNSDPGAMVQLGLIYDRDNENDKALYWYQRAADAGNALGKKRLELLKNWEANHGQSH